jgi:hypothetical protein
MSIEGIKYFCRSAITAIPIFASSAKAKVLQCAKDTDSLLYGLAIGAVNSSCYALIGYGVGCEAASHVSSTWAPHMSSLGATVGAYIGAKVGVIVSCDAKLRVELGQRAGEGAKACHLITMPFTLAQYGSKTAIATALAIVHFSKQIALAAGSVKESFTLAQGLNVLEDIRHIQDTDEERRSRGDLHGWSHEVDQLIFEYAR